MAFEILAGGLNLVIPTNGTTNWGTQLKNSTWQKINDHRHTGSGDGDQIPTAGIADGAVTAAKLATNLGGNIAATKTPTGTTETIDWDDGNIAPLDLSSATGDVTLTLSDPVAGATYKMLITQGGTARLITWPAAVLWPQGEEPSQYMEINTVNSIELLYDGTNYYGSWELDLR
jgi:hypothetical protein